MAPLLLIKPFGAQGPLQTSDAPTAITDLPATLLDLAGLPNTLETGTSALALDPARPRERTYAHYSWGGRNTHTSRWFDVLHLFSVDGRVTDPAAWRYRRAIFEPADDRAAQRGAHRIGLWADEDAAEPAAGRRTYVSDEYAAFFVPADTGRVTFDVRKAPALATQTVTVPVDGRVVDRRSLTDDAWHTLDYAVEARDADKTARSASSCWSARRGGRPTTTPVASCCGATSERRPSRGPTTGGLTAMLAGELSSQRQSWVVRAGQHQELEPQLHCRPIPHQYVPDLVRPDGRQSRAPVPPSRVAT